MKSAPTGIYQAQQDNHANSDRVIALDTAQDIQQPTVGSKAMSLIRMNRIGLPIPPGFCIISDTFRDHLKENNLVPSIESTLEQLNAATPEVKKSLLARIRKAILDAPFKDEVKREIEQNYHALGADYLAVRSSATAEDLPGNSFAGQHDTYLGVTEISDCFEAVKKCWASLWTERAYDYRQRNGFDHLSANMAVIIQRLIPADVSGVVFTADPVTGQSDKLVIEACFGLGESLVSGKVTPDRLIINRNDLRILKETVSEKKTERVLTETGKVKDRAVVQERVSVPCIDKRATQSLAKLAKRTESEFGTPQDIEWAIYKNEIFLLQSRPITALSLQRSWEDRQIWTNCNTGEVLPDVVTPANWSLVHTLIGPIFGSVFNWIGLDLGDNPIIGKVAGRVYFNMNTFAAAVRVFPGLRRMNVSEILGGEQGRMEKLGELEIPPEDIPDLHLSTVKMLFKMPKFMLEVLRHLPGKGERLIVEMRKESDCLLQTDLSAFSEEEIMGHLKLIIDRVYSGLNAIAFAGLGMFFFTKLDQACREWLEDKDGTFANRLLAGMGDMESAEASLELWRLAAGAQKQSAVRRTILAGYDWDLTKKKLIDIEKEGGREFLEDWDRFMFKHGHHARGELEVANLRWSESPDYILNTVRSYLQSICDINPIENQQKRAGGRVKLTQECHRQLRNPFKRMVFSFYLSQAQQGCVARENIKSVAVRYWTALRMTLLQLGKRLVDRDILEARDDIFFLHIEEIDPVRRGDADFEVRQTITARKAEHERNIKIEPPKVVLDRFDPKNLVPAEAIDAAEVLRGIAVSPGAVTGRARVILRSDQNEQVRPGEILVAPFTDPGWTPYFVPAAAIVMDQGGLLSHGSIVAREYGIPAVVNVGPATKMIKTGQLIQVDGTHGLVKILKPGYCNRIQR